MRGLTEHRAPSPAHSTSKNKLSFGQRKGRGARSRNLPFSSSVWSAETRPALGMPGKARHRCSPCSRRRGGHRHALGGGAGGAGAGAPAADPLSLRPALRLHGGRVFSYSFCSGLPRRSRRNSIQVQLKQSLSLPLLLDHFWYFTIKLVLSGFLHIIIMGCHKSLFSVSDVEALYTSPRHTHSIAGHPLHHKALLLE